MFVNERFFCPFHSLLISANFAKHTWWCGWGRCVAIKACNTIFFFSPTYTDETCTSIYILIAFIEKFATIFFLLRFHSWTFSFRFKFIHDSSVQKKTRNSRVSIIRNVFCISDDRSVLDCPSWNRWMYHRTSRFSQLFIPSKFRSLNIWKLPKFLKYLRRYFWWNTFVSVWIFRVSQWVLIETNQLWLRRLFLLYARAKCVSHFMLLGSLGRGKMCGWNRKCEVREKQKKFIELIRLAKDCRSLWWKEAYACWFSLIVAHAGYLIESCPNIRISFNLNELFISNKVADELSATISEVICSMIQLIRPRSTIKQRETNSELMTEMTECNFDSLAFIILSDI